MTGSPAAATGRLRAGLDIGNATTELVVVDSAGLVVAADQMPTRGAKGSPASLQGGAVLLRRCLRSLGRLDPASLVEVVSTTLRPVRTLTTPVTAPAADTGPLAVLARSSRTVTGLGFAAGTPWDVRCSPPPGPVVAVCPREVRYGRAAALIRTAHQEGADVVAVVVEADEAVLVGARTGLAVPVVDGVDAGPALGALALAVEVARPGHVLTCSGDAFVLGEALGRVTGEQLWRLPQLAALAACLDGSSNVVIAVLPPVANPPPAAVLDAAARLSGSWEPLQDNVDRLAATAVGLLDGIRLAGVERDVADLSVLDLGAVLAELRRGTVTREVLLATLDAPAAAVDPAPMLADLLGCEVRCLPGGVRAEALAARAGAWTTPGAVGAVVVDLGAGTCDVIGDLDGSSAAVVSAAGCGDLLTVAVGRLLQVPRAVAEYAKRGPALLVSGPLVTVGEDGSRRFLDRPAGGDLVGRLAVDGPVGLVALPSQWSPAEWRGVRRRAKAAVVGGAVRRALATDPGAGPGGRPTAVLLVGGPVADDEATLAVAEVLPEGCAVGRGRVAAGRLAPGARVPQDAPAGSLGHRFAVAYGLTLPDAERIEETP